MVMNPVTGLVSDLVNDNVAALMPMFDRSAFGVAKYTYDFFRQGGAITTIPLIGPALPANAVVLFALLETLTVPVGVGASIAIGTGAAGNDLQTAAAISGAPYSSTGKKALTPVMTASSAVDVGTANVRPSITISGAALTAGRLEVFLIYIQHD